jgi:hypothetical protein
MKRVNVLLNMEYTHIVLDYKLTSTSEQCHTSHIFVKLMDRSKAQKTPPPERTTDHGQATGKLYHWWLQVECTLFVIYKAGREPTPYW